MSRTGSLTMLQHPAQQIVSNPLSQFSRPRQSTLTTSPQRTNSDSQYSDDTTGPIDERGRRQSLADHDLDPSRDTSHRRMSNSPVSMDDRQVQEVDKFAKKTSQEAPVSQPTSDSRPDDKRSQEVEPVAKQKTKWRKSVAESTEGKEKEEPVPLRKEHRRRTLLSPKTGYCLHAIKYDDTKPGAPPQLRNSLKTDLPSAKTSQFNVDESAQADAGTEYGQHPAVRPLSMEVDRADTNTLPSSDRKGKEREVDTSQEVENDASSIASSVPSYSRCSCCGRVQKPGGFESELSPVLENENLRTNFNFEVENTSTNSARRSSSISSGPRRYVPIIPMEVGNETKQARIEPMAQPLPTNVDHVQQMKGVAVNKPGDVIGPGSTPLAIMPRKPIDPRFSRFGSLHAKKELDKGDEASVRDSHSGQSTPATSMTRFVSLYGIRDEAQQQAQAQVGPQASQSGSAYQTQQARHYSMPTAHRPFRSSRLAYSNDSLPATDTEPSQQRYSQASQAVEKPLRDSPIPSRNLTPAAVSDEDDGPAIDLSSFDGSFMFNNVPDSAVSSPTNSTPATSNGMNSGALVADVPKQLQQPHAAPQPSTDYEHIANIGQAISDPAPHSASVTTNGESRPGQPAPIDTNISSRKAPAMHTPSTTVVRVLPPDPVSSSSSMNSSKGPMRLGDWVLPASPSIKTNEESLNNGSQRRGVLAA